MLGFNGGLTGKLREPTSEAASGLWFPNEQSVAQRDGIWPSIALSASTDPDFASVSLLLHMDGSDGSTTFTDSSSNAFTVTASGDAQISTTDPKFGTGALTLDGAGDYLSLAADNAFQFGTGDFTVECWVYVNSGNTNNGLFQIGTGRVYDNSSLSVRIYNGQWGVSYLGEGGDNMGAVIINTWQHLAVTRSNGDSRFFINGAQPGSTLDKSSANLTQNQLNIGFYSSSNYAINARIDEFRVTKGVARYTANFTPPTAPFPDASGGAALTNPIPALSPVLWYDFDDAATVTLSGTTITQIDDKGIRGWDLTKSTTGPVQATWTNNSRKCVDWGSSAHSNYLRNTDTTVTDIAEIYVVLDSSFGNTFPNFNGLVSSTGESFFVVGSSGSTNFYSQYPKTFNAAYVNSSATNTYSTSILPAINSPALLRIKNTDDGAQTTIGGFQIGTDRSYLAGYDRGWYGLIAEVVCFSSVLSSTDRDAVETWLADKWNLSLA